MADRQVAIALDPWPQRGAPRDACPRLPRLMLITDRHRSRLPLLKAVDLALSGGVDAVQLRERGLAPEALAALARELAAICDGRAAFLVNNQPDLAAAVGAGVHLPGHGPPVPKTRSRLPAAALVGRSVHDPAEAAGHPGADYLVAGHVFATPSHPGACPIGLAGLAAITAAVPGVPVLAVGGIDASNVGEAVAAGASGIAVIGAIIATADPTSAAARLAAALRAHQEDVL